MLRFFYLILSMLLTACASSNITSSWVDSTYTKFPIKSTIVVAMSDDLRVRRIFEDDMVSQLRLHGVNAVPSSQVFPNKLPSKKAISEYVKKNRIQTALIAKLLNIENKDIRYPGNTGFAYGNTMSFHNYYSTSYSYIYDDSYSVSYEFVNVEFSLFDTNTHVPIWSTSSESVDPVNMNKIIDALTTMLISNMKDNKVIN